MKFVMHLCLTEGTCECMVWMKDCPEKKQQHKKVKITLFTSNLNQCYIKEFLRETLNYMW